MFDWLSKEREQKDGDDIGTVISLHKEQVERLEGEVGDLKKTLDLNSNRGKKTGGLVTVSCCDCGMDFGLTQRWYDHLKEKEQSFFCPNGHSIFYKKKKNIRNIIKLVDNTNET